jgi:hypothetical protein
VDQVRVLMVAVGNDAIAERLRCACPGGVRQPVPEASSKRQGCKGANANSLKRVELEVERHVKKLAQSRGIHGYTANHCRFWAADIVAGLVCPISKIAEGGGGLELEPRWGPRPVGSPLPIDAYRYPHCALPTDERSRSERACSSPNFQDADGYSRPELAGQAPAGVAAAVTAGMSLHEAARVHGGRRAARDVVAAAAAAAAAPHGVDGAGGAAVGTSAAGQTHVPVLRSLADIAVAAGCTVELLRGLEPSMLKQIVLDCVDAGTLRTDTLSEVMVLSKLTQPQTQPQVSDEEYHAAYAESCRRAARERERRCRYEEEEAQARWKADYTQAYAASVKRVRCGQAFTPCRGL